MGRLVDTSAINNCIMLQKRNWGIFATEINNIIDDVISLTPSAEAIPKVYYEQRLKADLEAILKELQLEIKCCEKSDCDYASSDCLSQWQIDRLIQEKINELKAD